MAKKNDVKIKGEADAMNVEKVTKNEWIDEGFGSGVGSPENDQADIGG